MKTFIFMSTACIFLSALIGIVCVICISMVKKRKKDPKKLSFSFGQRFLKEFNFLFLLKRKF